MITETNKNKELLKETRELIDYLNDQLIKGNYDKATIIILAIRKNTKELEKQETNETIKKMIAKINTKLDVLKRQISAVKLLEEELGISNDQQDEKKNVKTFHYKLIEGNYGVFDDIIWSDEEETVKGLGKNFLDKQFVGTYKEFADYLDDKYFVRKELLKAIKRHGGIDEQ